MQVKIICLAIGLFLSVIAAQGADADDRFKGGSYDGWGQAMTEYASLLPIAGTIFKIY